MVDFINSTSPGRNERITWEYLMIRIKDGDEYIVGSRYYLLAEWCPLLLL